MIVRRGNNPERDVVDYGPTPVAAERGQRLGGSLAVPMSTVLRHRLEQRRHKARKAAAS